MFVAIVILLHVLAACVAVYISLREKKADRKDFQEFIERLSEPPVTVPASPAAFRKQSDKLFRDIIASRPSTIPPPPLDKSGKLIMFRK